MQDFGPLYREMTIFYSNILSKIDNLLHYDDLYFNSKFFYKLLFQKETSECKWCKDLELANYIPLQNNWLGMTNNFISGRDFINYIKLRINALPSRVRVSRGNQVNKFCSAFNAKTKTPYHVIQGCTRTHGMRVKGTTSLLNT